MTFKPSRMETAAGIVVLAQLALAAFTATQGTTGPVPMHFDITGTPDRWGDRTEAAWVGVFLAGMTALIAAAIAVSLRTSRPDAARKRGLTIGMGLILAVMLVVSVLPAVLAVSALEPTDSGRLAGAVICLVLVISGAVLGKVPPNALVGVRTPWSLSSRLSWDRSNRLAGRLFFWGGLIGLPITLLLPPTVALTSVTTATLLIAAYVVFESWRIWKSDPDRRAV